MLSPPKNFLAPLWAQGARRITTAWRPQFILEHQPGRSLESFVSSCAPGTPRGRQAGSGDPRAAAGRRSPQLTHRRAACPGPWQRGRHIKQAGDPRHCGPGAPPRPAAPRPTAGARVLARPGLGPVVPATRCYGPSKGPPRGTGRSPHPAPGKSAGWPQFTAPKTDRSAGAAPGREPGRAGQPTRLHRPPGTMGGTRRRIGDPPGAQEGMRQTDTKKPGRPQHWLPRGSGPLWGDAPGRALLGPCVVGKVGRRRVKLGPS